MSKQSNARSITAVAIGVIILGASPLPAQEWPQWRGPHRDGKVTGFVSPLKWPTNLVQKWKTPVGKGDSSPALAGGKLYTFGRFDAEEVLLCLDPASGKILWEARYPANFVVTGASARHPGPRSTPAVADGKVCALGVGGILSCFDAATGAVLWRKQSTNDYLGIPYRSDSSMSPLVTDGRCFVHVGIKTNAGIFAFDLRTGQARWKWEGEGPANSSPVVMTAGRKRQLVTLTSKNLVGLGLEDGKLLWQLPFEATQGNNTTPIVEGSTVFYTGQGRGLFAAKIEAQGESCVVTPLWSNPRHGARFTTPILKDGRLYGYNNGFFCANAQTGATLWTDEIRRGQSAALLDAGSLLLALSLNGEFAAFKADPSAYLEEARLKLASTETWAHPVVAGKQVFIRDAEAVSLWMME